jgi:Flp pilus assembly protein TadG
MPESKFAGHFDRKAGTPAGFRALLWRLRAESSGASLVELAITLPFMVLLVAYTVDFGYFFLAAATIISSAHNGAQYSVQGYQSPAQSTLALGGPAGNGSSVAEEVQGDLVSLANSSTTTSIQVCSKANGISGNLTKCTSYGPTATAYTPAADPEAPTFFLQRVDVTYTVQPPVPLSFFSYSLLPTLAFHQQVSMRALD